MSKRSSVVLALVLASVAGSGAQAQQHQRGPMAMAGGMRCMGRDSATTAQMGTIHELVVNHSRITRTVSNLPDGILTVTESDDPRLADLIREHVVTMDQRVATGDNPGLPMQSPALRAIFQNKSKIRTAAEPTVRGIVLVQTSNDPTVVSALQQHAADVSDMAARGMAAMHAGMMKHDGTIRAGMCMQGPGVSSGPAALRP
jgi:hypothetical protein